MRGLLHTECFLARQYQESIVSLLDWSTIVSSNKDTFCEAMLTKKASWKQENLIYLRIKRLIYAQRELKTNWFDSTSISDSTICPKWIRILWLTWKIIKIFLTQPSHDCSYCSLGKIVEIFMIKYCQVRSPESIYTEWYVNSIKRQRVVQMVLFSLIVQKYLWE